MPSIVHTVQSITEVEHIARLGKHTPALQVKLLYMAARDRLIYGFALYSDTQAVSPEILVRRLATPGGIKPVVHWCTAEGVVGDGCYEDTTHTADAMVTLLCNYLAIRPTCIFKPVPECYRT